MRRRIAGVRPNLGGKRRIAGILDCHGGLRVVVGTLSSIYANCNIMYPEKLFLLPRSCWVQTDKNDRVPWGAIPWTVRRVELYIAEWCRTRNDPDDLAHIAIQRYLPRYALKNSDGTGGDGSLHIAGFLPPPRSVMHGDDSPAYEREHVAMVAAG